MALESENSRNDYIGTGLLNTYSYTFKIFEDTDLQLIVRDTDDVEAGPLTLGTDYTVTGAGETEGGTIVFVDNGQAWLTSDGFLKSNYKLNIRRVRPVTQSTSIRNQGNYYPNIHEDVFDAMVMISQQQQDELDRTVKLPDSVTDFDSKLPIPVPDQVLAINPDGDGFAYRSDLEGVTTTPFTLNLLDDDDAEEARTTLQASQKIGAMTAITEPAAGDAIGVADASESDAERKITLANALKVVSSLTEDTFPVPLDSVLLYSLSAGAARKANLAAIAAANGMIPGVLNGFVTAGVDSNAITFELLGIDGNAPSATNPVYCVVRNATAANGSYVVRRVTAATTLVISSGSTLGHSSAIAHNIWVYLIDNAGTIELGASTTLFDTLSVQSSTAEGGAGGADSASTIYSTAARSNVPMRAVARCVSTQTTAGTWAAIPSEISQLISNDVGQDPVGVMYTGATGTITSTTSLVTWQTNVLDTHNAVASGVFTAPRKGLYEVRASLGFSASSVANGDASYAMVVRKNGAGVNSSQGRWANGTSGAKQTAYSAPALLSLAKGGTVDIFFGAEGSSPAVTNDTASVLSIKSV